MSFYSNLPSGHNDTSSVSSLYPTLFEIVSAQEIDTLLPTSIRYLIVNYWISRHPSRFSLQVNNYFSEWFNLLLKGTVEWYHLTHYNSTFVDKFYGLQRFNGSNKILVQAQANSAATSTPKHWPRGLALSERQKRIALFEKVLLPYIKEKLDAIHAKYVAQTTFSNDEPQDMKKILLEQLYPLVKKLFYVLNLFTKLFFLSGWIGSITFLEYIFQIEYTRMISPLESSNIVKKPFSHNTRLPRQNLRSLWHTISTALAKANGAITYSGSQLFPAFIFMLRVYQWWTTQDLTAKLQRKLYEYDKVIPRANNISDQAYKSTEHCPVCHKPIQNPAVLETGYATCYPCAIAYLTENEGRCPVTHKQLLGCKYDLESGKWQVNGGVRKLLV